MLVFPPHFAPADRRRFFSTVRKMDVDSPANRTMYEVLGQIDSVRGEQVKRVYSECHVMQDNSSDEQRRPEARPRLLEHYEDIARASRLMLRAARSGDWEEVGRLEDRCKSLISTLKAAPSDASLFKPSDQRRRMQLLRSILSDDAQIRGRSDPWIKELEHLICSPSNKG